MKGYIAVTYYNAGVSGTRVDPDDGFTYRLKP
jgi:hypothetical protein